MRTSGLASLGGGVGSQLAHSSGASREAEAAPEQRTSHTSIALSGIQALNNKLSAMTTISSSLAQVWREEGWYWGDGDRLSRMKLLSLAVDGGRLGGSWCDGCGVSWQCRFYHVQAFIHA